MVTEACLPTGRYVDSVWGFQGTESPFSDKAGEGAPRYAGECSGLARNLESPCSAAIYYSTTVVFGLLGLLPLSMPVNLWIGRRRAPEASNKLLSWPVVSGQATVESRSVNRHYQRPSSESCVRHCSATVPSPSRVLFFFFFSCYTLKSDHIPHPICPIDFVVHLFQFKFPGFFFSLDRLILRRCSSSALTAIPYRDCYSPG